MQTYRLNASHIRMGMPLPGNVYDDAGRLLLAKGKVPTDKAQIDELLARGLYVDAVAYETLFKQCAEPLPENKYDPFDLRAKLKSGLHRLLYEALNGNISLVECQEFAERLYAFADTDAEAALAACLLDRDSGTYPIAHCLNVSILCAMVSRSLMWPQARRLSTVCAALSMNIGMLDQQRHLVMQKEALSEAQLAQIHAHPQAAVTALRAIGINDPIWLEAVAQHHEKPDGSGYPLRTTSASEEARMLRLADSFDALIRFRGDRPALLPSQAVRRLYVEESQGASAGLIGALVRSVGLHPPGSCVKLANNEIGVVFRNGPSNTTPVVASICSSSGMPLMQPQRRDTHRKGFEIVGAVQPDNLKISNNLGALWITSKRG